MGCHVFVGGNSKGKKTVSGAPAYSASAGGLGISTRCLLVAFLRNAAQLQTWTPAPKFSHHRLDASREGQLQWIISMGILSCVENAISKARGLGHQTQSLSLITERLMLFFLF